ncbi:MAG TPA: DUF1573 domain-containing protein, partial [Ignavibacteriaceae bacterium]
MRKIAVVLFLFFSSLGLAQLMGPKLVVQQTAHDFGDIKQGENVSHSFVLSNSGGDLLKILNVKASCGCTAGTPEKSELSPGESTNLLVSFNSTGRQGKQHKTVTVKTNDPQNQEIVLTITANILKDQKSGTSAPAVFFPETQHDFGKVIEGNKVNYTFQFQNNGSSTLTIKDIRTSCGCTAALVSKDSIEPGENGTLKIE